MSVQPHLVAWLGALKTKKLLPKELSDGTGRDAALPRKIAKRLQEQGLIVETPDGRAWALTQHGLLVAAGKA